MQLSYPIVSYDSVRIIFICSNQEIQYIQYVRPNLKKKKKKCSKKFSFNWKNVTKAIAL